jgi:deoxyribodipyrimidine photo-lyase
MGRDDVQVVWFKRDLRVRDHEPLVRAAQAGPVLPLVIIEPELLTRPAVDPAHTAWWLACAAELASELAARGAPLVVRRGDAVEVLAELARRHRVAAVWAHEEHGDLRTFERDRAVRRWGRRAQVPVVELPEAGVHRGPHDRDTWGRRFAGYLDTPGLRPPERLRPVAGIDPGTLPRVDDLHPTSSPRVAWLPDPGSAGAGRILASFVAGRARGYERAVSSPTRAWTTGSRLSAHLAVGTISARQVVQRSRRTRGQLTNADADAALAGSLAAFEERLAWRSHFVQRLEDAPDMERRSLLQPADALRRTVREPWLEAWRTGRTGWPMVDASIRSVQATGWLNFRMRAMLVSVATYHLWLPWQAIVDDLARWFLDLEWGIHVSQVQMQAGATGIARVRIYDPVKQGHDHDPDGRFVRRWVPELADVDDRFVHEPWTAPRPPAGYPAPVLDHRAAAAEARRRMAAFAERPEVRRAAAAVLERHGSRRPSVDRRGARS